MNMKFNVETMMVTGKNLFIKEPMALKTTLFAACFDICAKLLENYLR